ncbi:YggS family pyridoxal phosphate-dependent enzyme [Neolewinella lacunae]|uniref:Pyridoxal phosphate homeostasis protein n=1 Tax=Neolewinella lacunae TaxID=1517758 RepID=A0A923T8U6_9BACT|nr:YggS family pyridoxal phosphate-dependent enzyme [Neolewinella lacunae]MBC6994348.1 YggS family pyridoxal phosphate-dependent enzyme [Neolewinella lacunae]MDN3635805.1 YggS family pyridoxal phosphate-dependent enzyme [Neolewinella lacunae]
MSVNTANYRAILAEVNAAGAHLVAVSKTHPVEDIMVLYELGHRDFGENRVAELLEKQAALPKDIRWHFIGHLQRNKVRDLVPFVHLIHAVDSVRLLREIDKQAGLAGREVRVLLQFHIAEEESKYGFDPEQPEVLLSELNTTPLIHTTIAGVMGMATYTDHDEQIFLEFSRLAEVFRFLKNKAFAANPHFLALSMGMSGDYPIALQLGSTHVRVGSLLFGER